MLLEDSLDEPEPPEDHMSLDDSDDDDAIDSDSNPDEEFVELDPTGRYGRYAEVLGRGSTKTVYKAYDMVDCKEVAWNKAKPNAYAESPIEEALAIEREVTLLQNLNYKGIMKLYKAWVDERDGMSNFITELCSSTLLAFRLKHKHVSRKAVKSWARQILEGLVYLHKQDPPIIHRDLKCENILVKSCSSTTLKIGDFGCAGILDETHHMHAMVGTPEFMAPEMFQEDYNELVDVYSFGMCMLELLTRECPYSECASLAQVYKRVIGGEKPKSLLKVKDVQALQFINRCLLPASQRPSAEELLVDPFLGHKGLTVDSLKDNSIKDFNSIQTLSCFAASAPESLFFGDGNASEEAPSCGCEEDNSCGSRATNLNVNSVDSVLTDARSDFVFRNAPCTAEEGPRRRSYRVLGTKEDENTLRLKICIQESSRCSNIVFPFDLKNDTAQTVAEEMVRMLNYPQSDLLTIADLISEELAVLAVNGEENSTAFTQSGNGQGLLMVKQHQAENLPVGAASSSNTCLIESNPPSQEAVISSSITSLIESNPPSQEAVSGSEKGSYEMPASVINEESNSPSEEAVMKSGKGCCEMPASVTDEETKGNFYGNSSDNPMENEPFQGLSLAVCSSDAMRADKLSDESADDATDKKMDCSLPKQSGASHLRSSIAAHKKRLRLLLLKNSLNFKQVTKFPWKPPASEQGIRRRRPLYVNILA